MNNSRATVSCECAWSLALPVVQSGNATLSVATGEIHQHPLKFTVPAGTKAGTYKLGISVKFSSGETQEDAFIVNVLPEPTAPKAPAKVAIFDPPGETTKVLTALGVHGEAVQADADLSKYDLLIVGKGALTPGGPGPNLSRVTEGLRVLVFEQQAEVLEQRFGFRVQEYGLRETFRRIPDHPLLAGLDEELLRNWRGDATNMAPRLKYEQRPYPLINPTVINAGMVVTRAWRCGNRGNVASVLIEKPACGDFLPLIDGGYSLQYSTLMEYREGQGMVLFCQMDVTARTERDPAAERLARNLFDYVSAWKPLPRRTILYAGDPAGQKHLQSAGYAVEPYAAGSLKPERLLVVGPGGAAALAPDKTAIAEWIKQGGRLLSLGLDANEANQFLSTKMTTQKAEHIGCIFNPPAAASALVPARDRLDVHHPRSARRSTDHRRGSSGRRWGARLLVTTDASSIASFCRGNSIFSSQNTKRTFRRTSSLLSHGCWATWAFKGRRRCWSASRSRSS